VNEDDIVSKLRKMLSWSNAEQATEEIERLRSENEILRSAAGEEGRANRMTFLYESLKDKVDVITSSRDTWKALADMYNDKIQDMRMLAEQDSLALNNKDEEIRALRKLALDWEEVAKLLAYDLGKVEYADALYEDVRDGLYHKVRSRLATAEQNYAQDGIIKATNIIPDELIEAYLEKYRSLYANHSDQSSYLPSRDEYKNSKEIMDILNCGAIKKLIDSTGREFKPMLAEARVISSEIYWHRDCNVNDKESGNRYMGIVIALEDSQNGCGEFEYIPGSHLWNVDESVINETNIRVLQQKCFDYYRHLVAEKGATAEKFEHFAGNSMLWHGHILHRGDRHNGGLRHSLTVHYVASETDNG